MRILTCLIAALSISAPALCQETPRDVSADDAARIEAEAEQSRQEAERLAAEAERAEQEITRLQYALVEAAQARRLSEQDALEVDMRLEQLNAREAELNTRIEDDREAIVDVAAALVRIERARPPAMLAHGGDAVKASRAAGVLAVTAPALQTRIDRSLAELEELDQIRAAALVERGRLDAADREVGMRREEISALIEARTQELAALRAEAEARAAEARELAERARSLRELIAELEARAGSYAPQPRPDRPPGRPAPRLRPDPGDVGDAPPPFTPTTGRFADARGSLALPASGRIVTRFGETHVSGADRGIGIATRGLAQVTSPFDARVEFTGEFRGYGQLVILSVGDDYHIVLAGLSTIYSVVGQTLLAGEPIGEISPGGDSGGGAAQSLYVEIRRDGQPIDPAPWWREAR
ncbi:MAG: peptidoglycan DD-metalloendopeptidase family protein [Maricaulaceae bacterium]|jgi:septal ring factor EnvC (AmiA/AmiB activator)